MGGGPAAAERIMISPTPYSMFLEAAERAAMKRRGPLGYSIGQAAERLGCSKGSVRAWTDSGALGCSRTPGGQRRFSQQQIDDFIASL
jgi:excisionase family DNA binding protein